LSFGRITKLEWFYDYSSTSAGNKVVIINPVLQDTYEFKYPSTNQNRNYQVVLRAYSGTLCFQDFGPITIIVKGSPEVNFNPLSSICLNVNKFKLTEASEVTGMAGKGVYSGIGVNSDGFFDPAIAKEGTFDINYTFVANNGCSVSRTQKITVFPSPTVIKVPDVVILLGGQASLNIQASGVGLKYKWYPSIGLNNDTEPNPIASPKETTLYTLMVTSSDGCVVTEQVQVIVAGLPKIPNTFTPNSDMVNDTWNIKYLETYVNAKVTIFNRFGNLVFNSNGYSIPWDGKLAGKDVPVGVYYYVIDPRNGNNKFTGSVTIIR